MDVGGGESLTAQLVWLIGAPILLVVGLVGNGITLAVFLNPKAAKSSTSVYFIWLAFADALVLLLELPRWIIIYGYGYDIRHYNEWVCKVQYLGVYYPTSLSSYILLALTIERLISTVRPHQMKIICTPKSAHIVCGAILAISGLFSGMAIYGYGISYIPTSDNETLSSEDNMTSLTFYNNNSDVMSTMEPVTDDGKVMCNWLPNERGAIAMTMDNVLQFFFGFLFVETAMAVSDVIIIYKLTSMGKSSSMKQSAHIRQITITLVSINVVFILFRTPVFVFLSFILPLMKEVSPQTIEAAWSIILMLFLANHGVNFFLYVMIGQRFRKQVLDLLCGWRRRQDVNKRMTIKSAASKQTVITDTPESEP